MANFREELETCPICKSTGNCHVHGYYGRRLIDYRNGQMEEAELCVLRVICDSCGHTHAILPDVIVPYSSYGIVFILLLLGEYFVRTGAIEKICEKYGISMTQLYRWLDTWQKHKTEWLGVLTAAENEDRAFWQQVTVDEDYSPFASEFTDRTSISFLQTHRNPSLSPPAA